MYNIMDGQITENFNISEMKCKSGNNEVLLNRGVIEHANRLQRFREWYKRCMVVNSWYRTIAYNRSVGSNDTSQHVLGLATDVALPSEFKTLSIKRQTEWIDNMRTEWFKLCDDDKIAGGFGYYKDSNFVHFDSRVKNRAMWIA